ncbi:MAG: BRCT domain-containing protein, partial [Anaeroplasmataceae bacterium]
DQNNLDILNELKELGLNTVSEFKEINESIFTNKKVVITGTLSKDRNYFKELLTSFGANVVDNVSKNTDYLLCGENAGSKLEKAHKLNVIVINEVELNKLLN